MHADWDFRFGWKKLTKHDNEPEPLEAKSNSQMIVKKKRRTHIALCAPAAYDARFMMHKTGAYSQRSHHRWPSSTIC